MKKLAVLAGAVALLAIACVGFRPESRVVPADAGQPGQVLPMASADYQVHTTLEELTQEASVIAVGTVTGVDGTRNVARDPWNPELPHPSLEILAVDYRFAVDEFLKGLAPSTLLVSEAKFVASKGEEPARIRGFVEMSPGGRYLVFLRETKDGPGRWVGVAEPWRFALRGSEAVVESKWEGAEGAFPATDEEEFVARIRSLAGLR